MKKKKVLVDLSATLIHHGHIRILKKSQRYGKIIVALSTDKEIKKYKGYFPELNFKQRKEIVSSIKYVEKVIPSKWIITNKFLKKNKIDIIIRGGDHKKEKFHIKSIIFPRTKGISSKLIRKKAAKIFSKI
jgi:glycerol-3-phosphate cytidylyltransferase|tara:strand:+ start:37 stop:429 length:393 start_codon:yes stop_codon:yes gene_type:complete